MRCYLDGKKELMLWDTGSQVSLVDKEWQEEHFPGKEMHPVSDFLSQKEINLQAANSSKIDFEGIVVEEDCEYFIQIESYGKRIYAQEQLSSLLSLGIQSYIEKTFSSSQPGIPLFRVKSGPYLNKSEVNNARELLIKNNRQPLILKKCTKL